MATSLKLKPILSFLAVTLLFIILQSQITLSFDFDEDVEEDEAYVLDNPTPNFTLRGRFLASVIKKGAHCNPASSICNGVSANNGTSLLNCCKTHCRNILGDRNNCGKCGSKCKFGELCCNGSCTFVGDNHNHCGKCKKQCPSGVKCQGGMCGYA